MNDPKEFSEVIDKYIVDKSGKTVAVIVNIDSFEKWIDELEEYYDGLLAEYALLYKKNALSPDEVESLLS